MSDILIVGSVAFDTLRIAGCIHNKILGGSATYAAMAAAYFTRVQLVAVVGTDFPRSAIEMLAKRGIDLAGLETVEGQTFHWEGAYNDDLGSRTTIRTDLNVFADFQPKIPASYRSTPYVMLGNIHPELQFQVLEQIDRPRLVVADTMNLWIDIGREALCRLLERIDVLVVNDEEARQFSGEKNLVKAAKTIQKQGPSTIIIKKGEHGAILFHEDQIFCLPAMPLDSVADPTGAGDTFAGALIGYLGRIDQNSHVAFRKAVVYGSTLSSFCVERVGTKGLESLQVEDIYKRFKQFEKLVSFPTDPDSF
ncbi:MAG: bifunctional hydroxymethylpyrimidine kinase/phosphomethylpyrimidine kinase [Deltaproteobacteria bacterium]|nr:bifunctional hydroxymethylpyrimidine kinase/phosphomethylpyrimidine kinase [Deltaproteobacteria bacterium]